MLGVADGDVAQIGIGRRHGQVLVEEVGGEQIPGRAFMGDGQIAGLGAQLRADREAAAEQVGGGAFELAAVRVVLVAAKAQQAELVRLGFTQACVEQKAFRQEQLAGGDVIIGADAVLAAHRRYDRAVVILLVLQADGDFGQPAVLVINRVTQELQLGAENVLVKGEALAHAQQGADVLGIEALPRIGKFQPVEQADRDAGALQGVIGQRRDGVMDVGADAALGAIAGDHRPAGQTPAAAALHLGDAASGQQLAAIEQFVGHGRGGQAGKGQQGQNAHPDCLKGGALNPAEWPRKGLKMGLKSGAGQARRHGLYPRTFRDAGWSSPVARQAHNLKVTGSNPVPATKIIPLGQ